MGVGQSGVGGRAEWTAGAEVPLRGGASFFFGAREGPGEGTAGSPAPRDDCEAKNKNKKILFSAAPIPLRRRRLYRLPQKREEGCPASADASPAGEAHWEGAAARAGPSRLDCAYERQPPARKIG